MEVPRVGYTWIIDNFNQERFFFMMTEFEGQFTSSHGIFKFKLHGFNRYTLEVSYTASDKKVFASIEPKCFILNGYGEKCFDFGLYYYYYYFKVILHYRAISQIIQRSPKALCVIWMSVQ